MQIKFWHYAALAALVVAGACSDSGTATEASSTHARSASASSLSAPSFDYSSVGRFGAQSADFAVTSDGGSFNVGGLFTVNFPANSVCDPSLSTYADGQWDAPCVTLAAGQSIQLHAKAVLTLSGIKVDFTPHLRFAPSANVTISTDVFALMLKLNAAYYANHPQALSGLAIDYSPSLNANPVEDFLTDPSVVTHVDLSTGRVWRRVKHFSGYSQTDGQPCDPSPDNPDCVEVDGRTGIQ
jgi:hypothetical protein